jgi:hypothetical protein
VNGDRHARDVPDSDRGGEGGGERLEVRDVTRLFRVVVDPGGDLETVTERRIWMIPSRRVRNTPVPRRRMTM